MRHAIKTFEFEEGTQPDTSYKIVVYFRGKVVDTFQAPTMRAAILWFNAAGYERYSVVGED